MRIQRSVIIGIGAVLFVLLAGSAVIVASVGSDDDLDSASNPEGALVSRGDGADVGVTTTKTSLASDQQVLDLAFGDNANSKQEPEADAFYDPTGGGVLLVGHTNVLVASDDSNNDTSPSTTTADSTTTSVDGSTSSTSSQPDDKQPATEQATTSSSKSNTAESPTGKSTTSQTESSNADPTSVPSTATNPPATEAPTTNAPTTAPATTQTPTTTTAAPTTAPPSGVGSCASGAEFERTFRDDFNGSSVNQSSWNIYNSSGNAGNGLRRPSAMSVANGQLTITASNQGGQVVSGGMAHRGSQQYGRFSARVRTDVDPSRTMSGVILTWPASQVHPRDGENNMYETLPHEESATRNPFYSFIHKPYGSTSDQVRFVHRADASQWQTVTMEWTPSRIVVTVQGLGSQTVTETSADLIPDNPHIFTVQFDAFKQQVANNLAMQVDWVEIHKYCG